MSFGSMNDGGNDSPMAEINVTPLVDVMLVLLIVFMVTMPVLTHSIPLNLPTAVEKQQEQPKDQPKEPLRLSITATGEYYIAEEQVSPEMLAQRLKTALAQDPEVILAIAADKTSEHEALTKVLTAAQDAGLTKVGFVTETPAVLSSK